jgi:hypothetical protein
MSNFIHIGGHLMTKEFNNLLKKVYHCYRDHEKPPLPLKMIREYLEAEGIKIDKY